MRVHGKNSILHKLVFEVRYRFGWTYLDRCGLTLNRIMKDLPAWSMPEKGTVNPQGAPLLNEETRMVFNFSSDKYDLSLEQDPEGDSQITSKEVASFGEQAQLLSDIVNTELGLEDFSRVGFRVWYLFPFKTEEESWRWIRGLPVFSVGRALPEAFDGQEGASSMSVVVVSEDMTYRVAINAVHRKTRGVDTSILDMKSHEQPKDQSKILMQQQKVKKRLELHPDYAAMADVDAYVEEPKVLAPSDFISTGFNAIEKRLEDALSVKETGDD